MFLELIKYLNLSVLLFLLLYVGVIAVYYTCRYINNNYTNYY